MDKVLVETSARHVHVSEKDLYTLFGEGYELTVKKMLSQPGQFACAERVDVVGEKKTLTGVSILGPCRKESQVELSLTDARSIGVKAPIRESGDLEGSGACKLVGPKGEVVLEKGVIAAKRRNIPIQRSQPFFRPERRHLLLLRRLLIGSCRVRMVGVRKAGQRHAKEHALLPRIGLDQLRRHQIRNTCSVPLQQLCKCLVCVQIVAQRALLCQTQQMSRVFSKPFRFRSITRCSVPYAGDVCSIALRRAVVLCAVRQIADRHGLIRSTQLAMRARSVSGSCVLS